MRQLHIKKTSDREPTQSVCVADCYFIVMHWIYPGAPNGNFRENICSEDDLTSRIFGAFVVKFLAYLPLLGFSNICKMV